MSIRIDAIRLSGGTTHQHISHLWWSNLSDGTTGDNTREQIVSWIEDDNGKAYVDDAYRHRVDVEVVSLRVGTKYLRTRRDGVWTDNLLALPRH